MDDRGDAPRRAAPLPKSEGRSAVARRPPWARQRRAQIRLVVMEAGATPVLVQAGPASSELTLVVAQIRAESANGFAARIVRRILALGDAGQSIERLILLLGPRSDPEAMVGRLLVGRALIRHASAVRPQSCELELSSRSELHPQPMLGVSALFEALLDDVGSRAVTVDVSFVEPEPVDAADENGVEPVTAVTNDE